MKSVPTPQSTSPWNKVGYFFGSLFGGRLAQHEAASLEPKRNDKPTSNTASELVPAEDRLRVKMDLDALRSAVSLAEQPDFWDREALYAMYWQAVNDTTLASVMNTRITKVIGSPFVIMDRQTKKANLELTAALNRAWFVDFMRYWCEHFFYGHSLIEFIGAPSKGKGQDPIQGVQLIPRHYVFPHRGYIKARAGDAKGIDYRNAKPFSDWLVEVGDPSDLGLLLKCTSVVIQKNYSLSDWQRYNERFALPWLWLKSAKQGAERDKALKALIAGGRTGAAIIDLGEEIDIKFPTSTSSVDSFSQLSKYCDEQLSTLVLGQTMTTMQGSSRSQAEVQERVLNEYMEHDLRKLQFYINEVLLPFLADKGYAFREGSHDFVFRPFLEDYLQPDRIPSQQAPQEGKRGGVNGNGDASGTEVALSQPHGSFF